MGMFISGSSTSTSSFGKITIGGPVFNDVSSSRHSALTIHSPSGNFATGSAITIVGDSSQGRQRINWDMDGDDKVYSYIEARGEGGGDNRGELYFGTRNGRRVADEAVPRMGINSAGRVSIMGTFGQTESQVPGGNMMFNSASLNVFTGNTFDAAPYAGWFQNRVDAVNKGGIYISTVTGRPTNAIIRAAIRHLSTNAETKVFEVMANGQISGSSSSTGSFGRLVVGKGSTDASYGNIIFGVNGNESNERIVLRGDAVEVGPNNYFTGNTYLKGSVGGFTADPSLYVQKGIWVGTGNNRVLAIGGNNADGKTFIVAQGTDVDPGDFYIANTRGGRRIRMQVISGSTKVDALTIATGSGFGEAAIGINGITKPSSTLHVKGRPYGVSNAPIQAQNATYGNLYLGWGSPPNYGSGKLGIHSSYDFAIGTAQTTVAIGNSSGAQITVQNNSVTFASAVTGSHFSGSASSTGSFGQIFITDSHGTGHKWFGDTYYLRTNSSLRIGGYIYSDGILTLDAGANDIRLGSSSGGANTVHFKTDGSTDGISIVQNHLSGSLASTASFGRVEVNGEIKQSVIRIYNDSLQGKIEQQGDFGGGTMFIRQLGSNHDIRFQTNKGGSTSTALAIDGLTHNIGIGTESPGYKLDIVHNGDEQFRVGRSAQKYVAIRDDVMQFTGMTGNGMRIQTSDNSDIKFSAGTGDIIFDYGNSGGRVISYADIRVHGDIIAENYIVSSSVTHMTTSFSSGSTIFGDTTDDTHQFTGSLNLSGSLNINSISTTTSGDANAGVTLKAGGEKILQGWNEGNVNIGNGTFTTAYKIMLHGKTKVQNADIIVDQNKKYGWGNETVYLAGSEANGIDFYHSSTHLGRWRTAGLGVNTNITASGNIEVVGNISGSSTSTGSFGAIFNPGSHANPTKLTFVGSNANFVSGFGGTTSIGGAQVTLYNTSGNGAGYLYANHLPQYNYGIQLGAYYGSVAGIQLTARNGAHLYAHMTGSVFEFGSPVTSISGSASSTGSFGAGYIDNKLGIGTTSPADSIDIQQTDSVIRFKNTGASNWQGIELYNPSDNSFVAGFGSYANTTNGYIRDAAGSIVRFNSSFWTFNRVIRMSDGSGKYGFHHQNNTYRTGFGGILGSAAKATIHISGSGNNIGLYSEGFISGSSTSTGSFGRVELPSAYGAKAVISVKHGTDNGGLRLQGSTRATNVGSYIELLGGNHSYGSATFNYGYAPSNSTLSFTVGENEKIKFGGTGTITTQGHLISEEANGLISGSATSTGSFGALRVGSDASYVFANRAIIGHGDTNDGITLQSGATHQGNIAFNHSNGTTAHGRILYQHNTNYMAFFTDNTERLRIDSSGHALPGADNTYNLGSSTARWANIHSADLHLSNEDTEGNEVDGTTGNWTIQEGEDDLFILNKKNGKKYRFKLEEIT